MRLSLLRLKVLREQLAAAQEERAWLAEERHAVRLRAQCYEQMISSLQHDNSCIDKTLHLNALLTDSDDDQSDDGDNMLL